MFMTSTCSIDISMLISQAEVLERAEGIRKEYNELDTVWFMAGSLFQQYPFDIPTEAFSFEIFKQAFVAVQSCVVHLQGGTIRSCLHLVDSAGSERVDKSEVVGEGLKEAQYKNSFPELLRRVL
ncbi:hypothetical protein L6452_10630 [Arctium lappa]|uniref:Uncharacterized protein n=1 Tax=Arctium lappa TaxID=4217 RepID=A0ACB9DN38_ARCLA|nr:hypothetical protein L6452_10630 [Arctium lappa]